ncbi:unnamed protein product [Effrenium voratum]|nr:unnamed protein product [Effrenium voratum]
MLALPRSCAVPFLARLMASRKSAAVRSQTVAQRIDAATTVKSQVVISDLASADAENLFALYDFDGISLLPRGALTEVLRDIGLEKALAEDFGAFSKLAFDSHSADSHFLSSNEFKQLYYRLMNRYPELLPRAPALRVTVYSAKNLPPADVNGKADPYCTMQLAGKPHTKTRTRYVEKTLDPRWGEELTGNYAYEEGDDLLFEVFDYDRGCAQGDLLCTCIVPNKEFHREGGFDGSWPMTLAPELAKLKGYSPSIRLRIQVTAFPEPLPRVSILVRHADGLPPADANGKSDPFCSVQLVGKQFSRSSTTIKSRTLDPVWNETLTDKHRYEHGDSLSFKVWDYDKAGGNDLLGECVLDNSQFHKPGGFDGELSLQTSETKYTPTLSVQVLVREVEEAHQAHREATATTEEAPVTQTEEVQAAEELLRKLKPFATVQAIDAPHVLPYDPSLRGWWLYSEDVWDGSAEGIQALADTLLRRPSFQPLGLQESLAQVRAEWSKGYDGILGFSQGAILAALLCAELSAENGASVPGFAVLISGFGKPAPEGLAFPVDPLPVPSLHVWGEADAHIPPWASKILCEKFCNPRVHAHPGHHIVPQKAADLNVIASFVAEMAASSSELTGPGSRTSGKGSVAVADFEELRSGLRRFATRRCGGAGGKAAATMSAPGTATMHPGAYLEEELAAPGPATYERLLSLLSGAKFLALGPHEACRTSEDSVRVRRAGGWQDVTLHSGAKAMLLRTGKGEWLLAVLPADCKLSWKKVRTLHGKGTRMATEEEVADVTGCLPGAVPPIATFPRQAAGTESTEVCTSTSCSRRGLILEAPYLCSGLCWDLRKCI